MPRQRQPGWTLLAQFSVPLPTDRLLSKLSSGSKAFPAPPPLLEAPLTSVAIAGRREAAKEKVRLGIECFNTCKFDEAVTSLGEAVRLDDYNWEAHKVFADVLYTMGRDKEAISHYREAMTNSPLDKDYSFRHANILVRIGDTYRAVGDFENTLQSYSSARKLYASDEMAYAAYYCEDLCEKLGQAYNGMRRFREALEAFKLVYCSIEERNNPDILLEMSISYAGVGELKKAEKLRKQAFEQYQRLIDINPDNPTPYYLRARAYQKLARKDLAQSDIIMYGQLDGGLSAGDDRRIHPDRTERIATNALQNAALRFLDASMIEEAAEAFRNVTRLDPRNPDACHLLGECYQKLGRYGEALKSYEAAARLGVPELDFRIGECNFALNRFEEALRSFKKTLGWEKMVTLVTHDTHNDLLAALTYLRMGDCISMMGRQHEGTKYFRKALKRCNRAIKNQSKFDSGQIGYQNLANIHECRAIAYERLGDPVLAQYDYQNCQHLRNRALRGDG
jgi:tetratricopeptide (TPR) repeat protein